MQTRTQPTQELKRNKNDETGGTMRVGKLMIAYSRQKILRDCLYPLAPSSKQILSRYIYSYKNEIFIFNILNFYRQLMGDVIGYISYNIFCHPQLINCCIPSSLVSDTEFRRQNAKKDCTQ